MAAGAEPKSHPVEPTEDVDIFCRPYDEELHDVIASKATAYARWDNFPASPGHAEIVPFRHVASVFDLDLREREDIHALMEVVYAVVVTLHGEPDGWTIGYNDGPAAGQTVEHVHLHMIPRRHGDVPDPRGGIRHVLPHTNTPDEWAPRH